MKKGYIKSLTVLLVVLMLITSACSATRLAPEATSGQAAEDKSVPKYIFLFIGDGMGLPQITAYANFFGTVQQRFIGTLLNPTPENMPTPIFPSFTNFPSLGMAATQDASKFITDSASAATAIAAGVKALDGTLGVDAYLNPVPSIATLLKEQKDYKIGIVSSVSLDHATPAAFYTHITARTGYYDIAKEMITSGFEYFGGGGFKQPFGAAGDMPGILELMSEAGYTVVDSYEAIEALGSGGEAEKVIAVSPDLDNFFNDAALQYAIDEGASGVPLADFVSLGIEVLQNDTGFFMMVEGGKIDWACHANDLATAIWELHEFEAAVQVAVDFAAEYPDETLIIVTGDHETGGLSLGYNLTAYDSYLSVLTAQRISFARFMSDYLYPWRDAQTDFATAMQDVEMLFGLTLPDAVSDITDPHLILSDRDVAELMDAYELSMIPYAERDYRTEEYLAEYSMYAYEPFQLAITRLLSQKAGLAWASTAHSALPVPVFAMGHSAEEFAGLYDNTEIFHKLADILEMEK